MFGLPKSEEQQQQDPSATASVDPSTGLLILLMRVL